VSWPFVKLGDVAPAKAKKKQVADSSSLAWQLNLDQVESHTGRVIDEIVAPIREAGNSTHWFDERHVLYSKLRPYLNKVVVPEKEGIATTELVPMLPDPDRLDRKYLAHYLRSSTFVNWVSAQVAGAKMPRVSMKVFWEHELPLPPIAEQKRIAVILDKADALRRKRQQAIDLADQFLRSVFLEMFGDPVTNPKGWPEQMLSDIAMVRSGVTKGRKLEGKETLSVPYMRVANVQDGHIKLDDVHEIEVLATDVERYALKSGDLLLTEGGDPDKLGRGAVWQGEVSPCIHQNHIFCVRANTEIVHPEFLSAQIGSQRGKLYFLKVGKQTTGIATINKTVLSAYPAIVPSMEQQLKYVGLVERVRSSMLRFGASNTEMEALFQSVSKQAFCGEL